MTSIKPLPLLLALLALPFPLFAQLKYPGAPRDDTTYDLHGNKVEDPYRWLEDLDSDRTRQWIDAQNELAVSWLEEAPRRDWMRERLEKLWHYDKYGIPWRAGGRIFYTKKSGLQNQGVLFWHSENDDSSPKVLLDPNELSEDGTIALSGWEVSDDGKHLAYSLSSAGSDWQEWRVREVATGKDLPDHLEWVKFSGAEWSRDSKGFYYSRFDEPEKGKELEAVNYYKKLYYHLIGTPQSEDRLVFHMPDEKEWSFGAEVTEDGNYLVIPIRKAASNDNAVFYKNLSKGVNSPVYRLITGFDASWNFLGNDGALFYFHTTSNAPNGRVAVIDASLPDAISKVREILPESDNSLESVSLFGDTLIASYKVDAVDKVSLFNLDGRKTGDIEFPVPASVYGFRGRRGDGDTYYSLVGNTTPHRIYHYDIAKNESTVFREPEVAFDPGDFVSRQVFYHSKDGTRVPMFISHHKDTPMDGTAPCDLYGYGGFNISLGPYFSVSNVLWMEMGGVAAFANLRGGGEYGEAWHKAGWRHKKQNVFDDFIAAAEWLIVNKVTRTDRLAISGGSNGGLLVGACLNQRPDLFGAGVAMVGVFDMLRFHQFTIGWAWMDEFGSPGDAEDFKALYAYSPYHNTQRNHPYPPVLITTADHDDRVFPAHSFKFGAALQHAQTGEHPILLRIETKAGHGAGKPTAKSIEEIVDRWSFLARVFGM